MILAGESECFATAVAVSCWTAAAQGFALEKRGAVQSQADQTAL